MLGLTDRFDEFVVALARLLRFHLADIVYLRQNVMPGHPAWREIADHIVAEIRRRNAYDQRLYGIAAELFQRIVMLLGEPFSDELLVFKRLNRLFLVQSRGARSGSCPLLKARALTERRW